MKSPRTKALAFGVLASVLWGTVFVAARYLVDLRGLNPFYTAALRFCTGAAATFAFCLMRYGVVRVLAARKYMWHLVILGAMGTFLMGICVFLSARYTTSINSSLIVNSNAIFITIFALLIGERVGLVQGLGVFVGLVGCSIVMLGSAPAQLHPASNNALGCLLALGAAICWAAYTAFGKRIVRETGGLITSAWAMSWGGLMLAIVAVAVGGVRPLTGYEPLAVAYMGIFPTAIAMGLWYKALENVDSSALGPSQYVAPLVSVVLGWVLLREPLGPTFVAGGLLTLVGMYMAAKPLKPLRGGLAGADS